MDLDVVSPCFPIGGDASMVLWCLLSLWRGSFQPTMCIYPFYALFEWLGWSVCNIRIEGDGEMRRWFW
jgi:hypothetical protein